MTANKRAKGEGTTYQRKSDGMWCSSVELPQTDGRRRRKVVSAKTEAAVKAKLKKVKRELLKSGDMPSASQTLASWLMIWYNTIAVKKVRPKTAATYRLLIVRHIIPAIGKTRLDKLTPAHVTKMADTITGKGLSSTTALQAHRVLAVALKYAEREGRVSRNVATLADAPRKAAAHLTALTAEEGIKVLAATPGDPFASLWWAVLLTGARQGELLGLEIDRVSDVLDFSWQLQRLTWQHGCNPACGRKRGSDCPQRRVVAPADWEHRHLQGGLWLSRPKSRAGRRAIPLVEPLKSVIERQIALPRPNPHSLVWTMPDGSPIDPRIESEAWDALLKRAGVPDVRLHDGRHTTVDLLLGARVPIEVVTDIVGHSNRAMTMEYRSRANQPAHTEAMLALSRALTPIEGA